MKGLRRYIEIYSIMLRNSLIREMSFKANFILWMLVEVLWFLGQIVFFSIIFGSINQIGENVMKGTATFALPSRENGEVTFPLDTEADAETTSPA